MEKKTLSPVDGKNSKREPSVGFVAFASILIVLLMGAAVVMASLLAQYVSGRGLASDEPISNGEDLVILDGAEAAAAATSRDLSEAVHEVGPSLFTVNENGVCYVGVIMDSSGNAVIPTRCLGAQNEAVLSNGTRAAFTVTGADETLGITVIKLAGHDLRAARFAKASELSLGDPLAVFGCIDGGSVGVSCGVLSSFLSPSMLVCDAPMSLKFGNAVYTNCSGQVVAISIDDAKDDFPVGIPIEAVKSAADDARG